MGGLRVLVVVAAASLGAMVACSSFSSSTEATDAGGAADAAAPGTDAGTDAENLLLNGDFESSGCAGWGGNNAVLTASADPVHGGRSSCVVCTTGGAGVKNELFTSVLVDAPQKARFYGGAWLRTTPSRAPLLLGAHLDVTDSTGAGLQQGPETPAGPLLEEWHKAEALVEITATDGGGINLYFTGMESGKCFVIDDAWLYRTK